MQRWRGLEEIPGDWGRSVVTIGSFDGVHRGHQLIISRAVKRARELAAKAVVVTFDPHPSEVVRPGSHPALLAPQPRRAELIEALGVDAVLVLPFTAEFSKESPEFFVQQVLVDALHARLVIEGPNFRFGHRAAGNVGLLAELGRADDFEVEVLDLQVRGSAGVPFSSTLVRRLVAEGDLSAAAEVLGLAAPGRGPGGPGSAARTGVGLPHRQRGHRPAQCDPGRRGLRGVADGGR